MAQNCKLRNHNGAQMLCINNQCPDYLQQWSCYQCYYDNYYGDHRDRRHFVDKPTDRYKTHFKDEIEFLNNFQKQIQIIEDSIKKIEKEDHLIIQRIDYLRKKLDDFETYKSITVDNLKQKLYKYILYIQNLSYQDITKQEIMKLQRIQQSSICNYENYMYHNLSNTASQLADILMIQARELRVQISQLETQNKDQLQYLFKQKQEQVQQKPKSDRIQIRTMSMSQDERYIVSGGDLGQLILFRVQNQSKIDLKEEPEKEKQKQIQEEKSKDFNPIWIVDFLREPIYNDPTDPYDLTEPTQAYYVAVLQKQIKIYEIDFTQQYNLKEIKTVLSQEQCKDIKAIQFIDKSHLIIIGKVQTYILNINSNRKILDTRLNIIDIDICQQQNKILVGHKNNVFYFGDFRINEQISQKIFAQESNGIQKQNSPITSVKIQRKGYIFLTCHAAKYDDNQIINQENNHIKIWNFERQEIFQLQTNFLYANFIGQKKLFIIFTYNTYQIYEIFTQNLDYEQKPQASRIIVDKKNQLKTQCSITRDDQQSVSIYTIENNLITVYLEDVNVLLNQCQMSQFTPFETEQE